MGLFLLAAACGKGDDSDDDGSTGATATPGGTTVEPTTGGAGGTTAETASTAEPTTTSTTGTSAEPTTDATTGDPPAGLSCDGYCTTIAANCGGAETQYGGAEFCTDSCAFFPVGTAADTAMNTLGCRSYHAGAAAMDATTHCVHAGPGGAGVCGGNCEGFCAIARGACPEAWADDAGCLAACAMFADTEKFDANDVSGDTLACRLYHATAAAVDPVTHCPHVLLNSPPCM